MKTKNIFKTLTFAMLMPTMLLTTACSNEDDVANTSNMTNKGYALPVTVNVTRQADGATRASFDGSKLNFSAGDQLYVEGSESSAGLFSGTLTWQSGGTFSGTITTDNVYSGTADELFTAAVSNGYVQATLLPNGYGTYGFFEFSKGSLVWEYNNAFATSKATAIEQFSYEFANTYSSGFALAPQSAILNFTITGLTPNASNVAVSLTDGVLSNVSGNVTTDGDGTATFAVGVHEYTDLNGLSLTVGGNAITLVSSSTSAAAGKIYNITRSKVTDLSTLTSNYTAQNGETLTGELDVANYPVKISIAAGATVTLDNVTINGVHNNSYKWAGITCLGDATIILKDGTTNTVRAFNSYYPGLQAGPAGTTLTIQGSTGKLIANCSNYTYPAGAGIGAARNEECGNIVIEGGDITATGGYAGIGGAYGSAVMGSGTCGDITITGGTVTARAGDYSAGIGGGRGAYGSCGNITISGGTVTAISKAINTAAIGTGDGSTCTSVTITTGITNLTMTNSHSSVTGIVSNFLNATAVNANTTPITTMLSTSVTDATITTGMASAGFATLYDGDAKTWTVTKK